jgi:hypothetical protein
MHLPDRTMHGLINYIDTKANCRHLKKIDLKRNFAAGVYMSEARNPIQPPLTHCISVYKYTYSHRKGGEGQGQQSKIGTNMTDCISSLATLINTSRKVNFLDGDILVWYL